MIVELIAVPLLWLLLVAALGIWFAHLRSSSNMELELELLQRHVIALRPSAAGKGEVVTNFAKDSTLTAEQVQTVLQLAKDCGLADPVEVSIGRTQPLNR